MRLVRCTFLAVMAIALQMSSGSVTGSRASTELAMCRQDGYTIQVPSGWQVNLRGCNNANVALLATPDRNAFVRMVVAKAKPRAVIDIPTIRREYAKSGFSMFDMAYAMVDGTRFVTGKFFLTDQTHRPFMLFSAIGRRNGKVFGYQGGVYTDHNPASQATLALERKTLLTLRFTR